MLKDSVLFLKTTAEGNLAEAEISYQLWNAINYNFSLVTFFLRITRDIFSFRSTTVTKLKPAANPVPSCSTTELACSYSS